MRVNNDINSKVSLCQGDITKLNVDATVNPVNKALIWGGDIGGAIHEAAGPGLLDEYQILNGCETGECKVTLGHFVFYTVKLRDRNDYKLNDFCKICLQKVLAYNVKSIAFCCGAIGIPGFDSKKAA